MEKAEAKNYELRIKFLAEGIAKNVFDIIWISTVDNIVNVFTKVLRGARFKLLTSALVTSGVGKVKRGEANSRNVI